MKKILLGLVTVFALTFASITSAFADNLKIGVIDVQSLLQNLPQMTQMNNDMKTKFGDREKKLTDMQTAFQQDAVNFKKNSAVMSDKDKQTNTQKLMQQEQTIQQMQVDFQKDYKDYMVVQNKQVNALLDQLKAAVNRIAARDKYNLILVNTSVAYSDPSMDITQTVLAEMKK